VYDIYAHKL